MNQVEEVTEVVRRLHATIRVLKRRLEKVERELDKMKIRQNSIKA